MQLINNEKIDILHILPLLPSSGQNIPFVSCCYNNLSLSQKFQIRSSLSRQLYNSIPQKLPEFVVPIHEY